MFFYILYLAVLIVSKLLYIHVIFGALIAVIF